MKTLCHAYGAYASYPSGESPWRLDDHRVNRLVKAIKGRQFSGGALIYGVDGVPRLVSSRHRDAAFELFARWAAKRIADQSMDPAVIVPVPSSSCVEFEQDCPAARMSLAMRAHLPDDWRTQRWLRFTRPRDRSTGLSTREVEDIACSLEVRADATSGAHVVLVDDVLTTGAHLKACVLRLAQAGVIVDAAFVAASTTLVRVTDPWAVAPEVLEEMPDAQLSQAALKLRP